MFKGKFSEDDINYALNVDESDKKAYAEEDYQ